MTLEEENILEDLAMVQIMSSIDGRHLMMRILDQSGVDNDGFSSDPYVHARNSGCRSVGLWLQSEIQRVAPESYTKMKKESISD